MNFFQFLAKHRTEVATLTLDVAEDGGRPWIVMQLVDAQSLDQVLASSGPLSPRRAAEMARQLLSGIQSEL